MSRPDTSERESRKSKTHQPAEHGGLTEVFY
jgi:hypothetical protein